MTPEQKLRAWLDDDGEHVLVGHQCWDGQHTVKLPHPQWSADTDGNVSPSVHCLACGVHEFVTVALVT